MIRLLLAALAPALLMGCQRPGPVVRPGAAADTSAATRQLQARYQGRDVWVYGGGPLTCTRGQSSIDMRGSVGDPVRVVAVRRLIGRHPVKVTRGGTVPAQPVSRPFELVLRPGPTFKAVGGGSSEADLRALMASGYAEVRVLYADFDHIGRVLSLTAPSAETLRLVQRAPRTRLGLTHLQVLWLQGAPEAPVASVDSLLRAPLWTTYGPPGYGDWTVRFRGDRVVAETAPDPMP